MSNDDFMFYSSEDDTLPTSDAEGWLFDLSPEEEQQVPLTSEDYRMEVDKITSDPTFYDQPYEDQISLLRQVYLGPKNDGTRDWEDEEDVVKLHQELANNIRQANNRLIRPEDYADYLPGKPDLSLAETTSEAYAMLDDWEEQAKKSAKLQMGIGWTEIEEPASQQIEQDVDQLKRYITAKNFYGGEEEIKGEKKRPKYKEDLAEFALAVKAGAAQTASILPDVFGGKAARRAVETSRFLPDTPYVIDPENNPDPEYETPFGPFKQSELIGGMGSLTASLLPAAGFAKIGAAANLGEKAQTAISLVPLMTMGTRLAYKEAYDKVYAKTQNPTMSAEAGWKAVPGGALDGAGDAVVGLGLVPEFFTKLGNKFKTKFLAKLAADGFLGGALRTGFSAVVEGSTEGVQAYLSGLAEESATGDPSFRATGREIALESIVGAVGGTVAGVSANEIFLRNVRGIKEQQALREGVKQEVQQVRESQSQEPITPPETETPQPEAQQPIKPKTPLVEPNTEVVQPEPAPVVETGTSQLAGVKTEEIPLKGLEFNAPELPQFKSAGNEKGIVEPLQGTFERLGTGPIVVFETQDGRRVIASGRHRADLAQRSGEETIPAQVIKESEGYTFKDAQVLDAELNIRDEQGTVQDFANYFRVRQLPENEAKAKGLLSRVKGRQGFAIGTKAEGGLYNLYTRGGIQDAQAAAIANAAPNNPELQQVGVDYYNKLTEAGRAVTPEALTSRIKIEQATKETQGSLFGDDVFVEPEQVAETAEILRKEANSLLNEKKLAKAGTEYQTRLARVVGPELAGLDLSVPENAKQVRGALRDKVKQLSSPDQWGAGLVRELRDLTQQRLAEEKAGRVARREGEQIELPVAPAQPKETARPSTSNPILNRAIEQYGTTSNVEDALYVLPDGQLLAGPAEGHSQVASDASEEARVGRTEDSDLSASIFMEQTKALRIIPLKQGIGISIIEEPTRRQKQQIIDAANARGGELLIDLEDAQANVLHGTTLQNPTTEDLTTWVQGKLQYQASLKTEEQPFAGISREQEAEGAKQGEEAAIAEERVRISEKQKTQGMPESSTQNEDRQVLINRAIQDYGVTDSFKEVSYLLPDGQMLGGSGQHSAIASELLLNVLKEEPSTEHGTIARLMDVMGVTRIEPTKTGIGVSLVREPTRRQKQAILRETAAHGGELLVDFYSTNGDLIGYTTLENPTIEDLDRWIRGQETYQAHIRKEEAAHGRGSQGFPERGSHTPPSIRTNSKTVQELNQAIQTTDKPKTIQESTRKAAKPSEIPDILEHPIYGDLDTTPEGIYRDDLPPQEGPDRSRGDLISAPDVVTSIDNVLRKAGSLAPLREATERRRGVLGAFYTRPEVIRTKVANDIQTATHEMAHALEKELLGKKNPWTQKGTNTQMKQELLTLGKELYGDETPTGGYMREGWAEFIRHWVTGEKNVQEKAPVLSKWFDDVFSTEFPNVRKALDQAQKDAKRYFSQTPLERGRIGIVEDPNLYQRIRDWFSVPFRQRNSKFHKDWIEFGRPVFELQETAARMAKKFEGRELNPEEKAFDIYDSLRATHVQRLNYMVNHGMIDAAGNLVGPGLNQIFAKVRQEAKRRGIPTDDFMVYLWAKRAIALRNDSKHGTRNPGLSKADAEQIITQLESSGWIASANEVYAWQDGLLNYMSQMSPRYANIVASIREVDPGFYVPLQREFHNLDNMWDRAQRSARNQRVGGTPLQRLKGSGRRIINPITSMMRNAERMLLMSHQRAALDAMLRLRNIEGMGHLITKIPRQRIPVANRNLAELMMEMQKVLNKNGIDAQVSVTDKNAEEVPIEDLSALTAVLFAPAVKAPNGEVAHMLNVDDNGYLEINEIDSALLDTLTGMDLAWFSKNPFLKWGVQVPLNVFRLGTTGLRFGFSFITNPMRDFPTFVFNHNGSASMPSLLWSWMDSQRASLFNQFGVKDPYLDVAERLGATMGQSMAQSQRLFRTQRNLIGDRTIIDVGSSFYDLVAEIFQIPEKASRRAELKLKMEELGLTPGDTLTPEQAQQLILAYKQVTTDFSAAGEYSRMLNMAVPYFNASIQGPRAHLRAIKRNPKRASALALGLAGLAAANWFRNKDEDWWQELSDEEKYLFSWIPFNNPMTEDKQVFRMIRPFELGGVTMALTESILDAVYKSNPELIYEWGKNFLATGLPLSAENVQPILLREWIDQQMGPGGYDQYWERPIVPFGETFLPPEQQFNEYTSETAKFIGDLFQWSPRRIDHAIKGILGGAASDLVSTTETLAGLRQARPEKFRSLTGNDGVDFVLSPFTSKLLRNEDEMFRNSRSVQTFYDHLQDLQAYRQRNKTKATKRLSSFMTDAQKSISALRVLRLEAKSKEDRLALSKQALEIAKKANQAWEEKAPKGVAMLRGQRKNLERRAGRGPKQKNSFKIPEELRPSVRLTP